MVIDMEFIDTPLGHYLLCVAKNGYKYPHSTALKISAWNSGLEFRLGIPAWKISAWNSGLEKTSRKFRPEKQARIPGRKFRPEMSFRPADE